MNCAIIVQPQTKPFRPEDGKPSEPNNQLERLGHISLIRFMARRLKTQCPELPVIFAISEASSWDAVADEVREEPEILVERIPDIDRLKGFTETAWRYNLDAVARITGDVPFHDGNVIRGMFKLLEEQNLDLVDNGRALRPHPFGLDVISTAALERSRESRVLLPWDKLHVVVHAREFANTEYAATFDEEPFKVGYYNLDGVKYENPKNLISATPEQLEANRCVVRNLVDVGLDPYKATLDQIMAAAGATLSTVSPTAGLSAPEITAPKGDTQQLQERNFAARWALFQGGPTIPCIEI